MNGFHYQHMFITLFGPHNETMIGELNMTGMTMTRTDPEGVAASEGGTGRGGGGGGGGGGTGVDGTSVHVSVAASKSVYDSRGAAYYICIVILVYALAILSFVISLARRRHNRDKYRLAHDGHMIDYVTGASASKKTGQQRGEGCWKQRKEDGLAAPSSPSPWSSSSSRSSPSDRSNGIANPKKEIVPLRGDSNDVVRLIGGAVDCSVVLPDEVITLVQVLPNSNETKTEEEEAMLYGIEPLLTSTSGRDTDDPVQQKCRWSMGPDGNIWILQVEEAAVETLSSGNTTNKNDHDNDNSSENKEFLNSQSRLDLFVDQTGVNQSRREALLSHESLAKTNNATTDQSHQRCRGEQRKSKNFSFSPVPKGYRPRGRSLSRERKPRPVSGDGVPEYLTTLQQRASFPSKVDTEGKEDRWEEYHFLDPEPFFIASIGSPDYIQKLIHVTSV